IDQPKDHYPYTLVFQLRVKDKVISESEAKDVWHKILRTTLKGNDLKKLGNETDSLAVSVRVFVIEMRQQLYATDLSQGNAAELPNTWLLTRVGSPGHRVQAALALVRLLLGLASDAQPKSCLNNKDRPDALRIRMRCANREGERR